MIPARNISELIEFIESRESCRFDDFHFIWENKRLIINGWTNYQNLESLTKSVCISELEELKERMERITNESNKLKTLLKNIEVEYHLSYDYSKGGLLVCKEIDENIEWILELKR